MVPLVPGHRLYHEVHGGLPAYYACHEVWLFVGGLMNEKRLPASAAHTKDV